MTTMILSAAQFLENARKEIRPPADLPPALEALWWDAHGDLHRALEVLAEAPGANEAWVRAYLRRKLGDESIAAYWYAKAIRPLPTGSFVTERDHLLEVLLGS